MPYSDPCSSTQSGDSDKTCAPVSKIKTDTFARFLLRKVDREQKKKRCESLHKTYAKCTILPSWNSGHSHLIRKAAFEDGTRWVIKIRFPKDLTIEGMTKSNIGRMKTEYETHGFLQ